MVTKPDIPIPAVPIAPTRVKSMLYAVTDPSVANPNTFRVERGVPFLRAGVAVTANPQFKTLSLKTPVAQSAITNGLLDPSKPGFLQKGSNVPTFVTVAFTFNATSTTTLTISWPATPIRRANKQVAIGISSDTAIPAGSISLTGLTANTQYFYYPFWSELAMVVGWAGAGNATSAGSPAIAQTAQSDAVLQAQTYQGFVPISSGALAFTQPAAGTLSQTGGYASGNLNITGGGRTYTLR